MGSTSSTTLSALLETYFEKKALEVLHEDVYLRQLVSPENVISIPRGMGTGVQWSTWRRIAPASSTLSEFAASANVPVDLSCRKVTASVLSYGRVVRYTDLIEKSSVLNVQQGALQELSQSAALTVDNVMQYSIFKADLSQCGKDGTNVATKFLSAYLSAVASAFCANTGTGPASRQFGLPVVIAGSATRLSAISGSAPSTSAQAGPYALNKGVARLKNFGSRPFADGYRAVMHTYAHRDMLGNPDFQKFLPGWGQGVQETVMKNVVGKWGGCSIMVSQNMPRFVPTAGNARRVSPIVIVGREALGCTEIAGDSGSAIQFIITEPGGTEDPFKLKGQVAYKIRFAGAVLNPSAGVSVLVHERA